MNICFFLGGFYQNGGIGRVTSMLANEMAKCGRYNIATLCYCNQNLPNIYEISPEIKQQFFLQAYSSMAKEIILGGVKRLKDYLTENEIDVLIACGALFYPISVLACEGLKTKCICWEHSDPEGNNDHRGQYLARRFGIKKSDLNVVLTQRAFEVFQKEYGILNTVQIYNPVDEVVLENAGEYNPDTKRIISVGRLTYQKNFQMAVEVASQILPKYPEWHWDVFGKGDEEAQLQEMINEKGISKQFHLRGQVSDMYERYKQYSVMVMTSRYEGFPMSLLEGLGNGLPLISFDIPTGPSEIIENGRNGYLIQAFDINMMKQRLTDLIEDRNLLASMSHSSKEKVRYFSQREIVKKWNKVLTELCRS